MAEYEEFIKDKQQKHILQASTHNDLPHFGISSHHLRGIGGHQVAGGHIGGVDLTFSNSSQNASEEGSSHFMRPGL